MRNILAIAVLLSVLCACSDQDGAIRALEDAGYKEIQVGGAVPLRCGKGDSYSTAFRAKGATGRQVDGVVCAGMLKGSTIRTF